MLTDTAIKALRSQHKLYKVSDRTGMYVVVQRLNGRRETLTLGRYGPDGLSLARAREKLIDAKRAISEGRSPAQERPRWSCLSWSLMFVRGRERRSLTLGLGARLMAFAREAWRRASSQTSTSARSQTTQREVR
ncbi:uncharacterized protein DUF4102 [Rhizobium sullae]|uniref:Uncharacterized protein DUF4102 n=1 Tax=Rhizobium sullae TaxID=50338 RepID=A0A4R3QBU7_RHISU|nr:uncharacterized protein DUF4102 [Rhizobium sullae]